MRSKTTIAGPMVLLGALCIALQSCSLLSSSCKEMKYLSLHAEPWQKESFQHHIKATFPYKPTDGWFEDDRVRMKKSNLSLPEKINFLAEYLCFYRNDHPSSRGYSQRYGRQQNRARISTEHIGFPIEVEALYSLTSFLKTCPYHR